ncbi:venom peptide MmKTx1-like isoform X2 [Centruroides sculpturatus]|uniref:venom peptide MmKTx1-like isoform X1 n=1 Tax=Centruroides sculpturatus TaxID=218467 RepID=UPI000C6E6C07|nr:venom peptide MmKTx1-like isoform X1 [Centruroides sculpturatus]XP_023220642.1 venom peptide MmKTx1-like isoform X2 [Centruroides sculpturatus]
MSIRKIIFILFSFVMTTQAIPYFFNSVNSSICKTRTGEVLQIGEKWHDPDRCVQYSCEITPIGTTLIGKTCSSVIFPSNCRGVPGKGQYPDCCINVECEEDDIPIFPKYNPKYYMT